ncbi:MarR family winged helix-turn-helix transcriptional regulator [Flavihumibacter petaseus]|uniref:Putative MarR family transcriptional regulator n=1 Tax=Flavihumibacter petaseus NBRC 106054 TaxID=1220578 RepID=A0A0E9N6B5_9BACT|nr:MarR family transcriptional regulator [Flavihumibacter petaseus]GAO44875.1 putative MarR family transcriptional regulator [Flavihumibacter petaseus NBRC 106054]
MTAEKLGDILFYSLEKSIKSYRQFAQRNITKAGFDITIDQWLLLKTLQEDPEATQQQIADKVFKDYASITRMIDLLVKKKLLKRKPHPEDRRRFALTVTADAETLIEGVQPLVEANRRQALQGINLQDVQVLREVLEQMISNCQN